MEDRTRQHQLSIKMSIESRKSNLSSCRSLERPSWVDRRPSLNKNHSLIEVMSLESNRRSDIYEKMLEEDRPLQKQSLGGIGIVHSPYEYVTEQAPFQLPNTLNPRKSSQQGETINHTCKCYTECEWQTCECFQAKNQPCISGFCCQGCIDMKKEMLQKLKDNLCEQSKIYCTCKKTKCRKKYCTCFAAGIMCGEKCSCQGCLNCLRKSEHGMDVEEEEDPLTEEQLGRMVMPEKMEFEPFNFGRSSS